MLIVPLVFALASLRTVPHDDCQALLLKSYKNMEAVAGSGKVLHLQVRSETFYVPPGQKKEQHSTAVVEMFAQGNSSVILTPFISTWQDEQYTVSVIKPRKTVLITRSLSRNSQGQLNSLPVLRDSLLREGTISVCRVNAASHETYIELHPAKKGRAKIRAQTIEFWLNNQNATIKKMRINYLPGQIQNATVITFTNQEQLATSDAIPANVRRKVLTTSGQLLPAYAGYRLIDQSTQRPR